MDLVVQADGDADFDWSEPGYNVPAASDDERLAELARQSERLSGKGERKRTVELLEDDARYLTQEIGDREAELMKWEKWYSEAPDVCDEKARWEAWYGEAPTSRR